LLSGKVNTYADTVDDYTNDLCSRDYLAALVARASSGLRSELDEQAPRPTSRSGERQSKTPNGAWAGTSASSTRTVGGGADG